MKLPIFALITGLTFLAGAFAHAESDLARQIRQAKDKNQQKQDQEERRSESELRVAQKKAVVLALALNGVKAAQLESAGEDDISGRPTMNVKLTNGELCEVELQDRDISEASLSEDVSDGLVESRIKRTQKLLAVVQRLADARQTRVAQARIAQEIDIGAINDMLGRRGVLNTLQSNLGDYITATEAVRLEVVATCYNANGGARGIVETILATKNGAAKDVGF